MKVQVVPVSKVTPYARNPRKNLGAIAKVKASLAEFGWRQPIVVDTEMVIVVGHTRYAAAIELGMTEVPVHVATGLTAAQIKAYRIADNRTNEEAEWDRELLALELGDLQTDGYDLGLTAFNGDELSKLLSLDGSDLMDPTDGHGSTNAQGAAALKWGKREVPLTEEEVDILERAFTQYVARNGVAYGFLRDGLARVDLH